MREIIIDVREQDEFKAEHIEHSINVPLSKFAEIAPGALSNCKDSTVVLMCRSGKRAQLAKTQAQTLGLKPEGGFNIYVGGILAWKAQGNATVLNKKNHLPILRQTHLAAGILALSGVVLGYSMNPLFFLLSGMVGLGLTISGATGLCLMSELLLLLPWNEINSVE